MTHLLIVDHEVTPTHPLTSALKGRGIDVTTLAAGTEAHAFALQHRPDAIILCVELQGGSGYTVCNRLKKDETTRVIPLMLSSSEATQAVFDEHRRLRTHADAYLFKPYDAHGVVAELHKLMHPEHQAPDEHGTASLAPSRDASEAHGVSPERNDATHVGASPAQELRTPQGSAADARDSGAWAGGDADADSNNDPLMSTDALLLLEGSVDVNQHTQVIRLPVGVRGEQAKDLIGEALADMNSEEGAAWTAMQGRIQSLEAQVRAQADGLQALQAAVDALGQELSKSRAHSQKVMQSIGSALHSTGE